jgi:hypothetical protein
MNFKVSTTANLPSLPNGSRCQIHRKAKNSPHALHGWASIVLLCALVFVCFPVAYAQTDVGHIVGTVTDQSGALVTDARVQITNEENGLSQTVTSNGSGYYASQPLQPGRYAVVVEHAGFQSFRTHNIVLDVAASVTADAKLIIGTESSTVVVEALAPALNLTDPQISNTIDQRDAQQLPVNGRSVLALATLTPGVESGVGAVSEGFANRGTSISSIRISGGVMGLNNNLLDGVTNVQSFDSEVGINVKSDAVQEFRIMTGVIPVQFGYTSGGVINVITRAGGDKYHGSLYEFFRNDALDAEIAFPKPTFGKPETRFNNYGAAIGGPILKEKLFFFANYDGYRYVSDTPSYLTVPTDQEYGGNFSDLGHLSGTTCVPTLIYNPATAGTTGARTQFLGNQITNIDPVAAAFVNKYYPHANNTSGPYNSCTHTNNYIASPKLAINENTVVGRLDYKATAADTLTGRYALYQNLSNNAANYSPIFGRNDNDQIQNGMLSETHVFSPTLLNDVHLGLERSGFSFNSATNGLNIAGQVGLPNDTPDVGPLMSNGLAQFNDTVGFRTTSLLEILDDVTKVIGAHTVQFGASARFSEAFYNQSNGNSGTFNFSANQTAAGNNTTVTTGTGSQFASFLAGAVASASNTLYGGTAFRRLQYAGYVQDNWRATKRLNITAGLRYDFQPQAYEKHNGIDNVDLSQPNPSNPLLMGKVEYAGLGYGSNFVNENFNDWGPRVGFNLVLTNDNKTSLRGGYAIYYASTATQEYDLSSGNTNGFNSLTTSFNSPTPDGAAFQLSNGFPGTVNQPLGAAGGQTAFLGSAVNPVLSSAKDPSSQQYSLSISRQLWYQTVLDITYLGNQGHHYVLSSLNENTLDPKYFGLGTAYLNASVANPYAGMVPGSLGAATITRANLMKPYPYYTGVTLSYPRNGTSDGNYLYVTAQRRVQHGLQVIASYTYGKLVDTPIYTDLSTSPGAGISTSNGPQNPRDLAADRSVDTFDVQHRMTVAALYDLPFGKGQRFLASGSLLDRFVGGFQFNVIMTLESGRPLLITGATNQGIATRPNFNPNVSVRVAHPSKTEWFNPLAFLDPPDYSFGNVPRTYSPVRGPGQQNFDMSVFKTTGLSHDVKLELRVEAFNALNKTNLQNPNSSFTAGPANPASGYPTEGGSNTNANFGVITAANAARVVQLGAKIIF